MNRMVRFPSSHRFCSLAVGATLLFAAAPWTMCAARPDQDSRPLPDIPTLLRDIVRNQQALEDLRKLYTCHLSDEEYDVFYIGDDQVLHLLAKDGKPLGGEEKRQEDDRFNKRFDDLKKKQAQFAGDPKKQAKKEEEDEAEVSDFLRAELFTNPRRDHFRGQEVIAFDFNGNPEYKPKKRIDGIIQKLTGVMWVDEQAREIVRLEARFAEGVKVGGGLLGSLEKGSNFVFEQEKINDEVWLPSYAEVHFAGRIFVVKLKQNSIDHYTDYKKFRVGTSLGSTTSQD